MYKVDPILRERLKSRIQTKYNNTDPRPQLHITRKQTPITTQRFWENIRITPTVGTRSSIAVRRPEGHLTGDMIFVALVEDGNAVIRKAEPRINLTDMVWSPVTTINNVSELSIMFDGYMKMVEGKVESYTTGELPIVFYVDSDNSLKGWNMNTHVIFTISDTAYNVASVRGLYSEAADLNDGIFVFYTNGSGELWEARVLNDEVVELTQITLKPDGVTGWIDVWATLTFDYRISLQLEGDDGNVYSLLSASRPSGFSLIEYFENTLRMSSKMMLQCGVDPPIIYSISNRPDTPLVVKIMFDRPVTLFNPSTLLIWIRGGDGKKITPEYINKTNNQEITLYFGHDLLGVQRPHYIEDNRYNPCGFGSVDGISTILPQQALTLFNIDLSSMGNDIFNYHLQVSTPLSLTLEKAFDGKAYVPGDTFINSLNVYQNLNMLVRDVDFQKGYITGDVFMDTLYLHNKPTWTYLNVDGTPV